ncbi:MAG TPA: J domain-containing protein [Rubricoccaceae bacterium]|jgi:hypothetical protein
MPDAFPLSWPLGRPRTRRPKPGAFKTTPAVARDGLMNELRLLGASSIVVSSNVATYRRGGRDVMYADQSGAREDPGVAVYYVWRGEQYVLACDRWARVQDNVRAIGKTVEALRGLERWGTGEMVRAAFAGFKALPAPGEGSGSPWWTVLGVGPTATADEIRRAYRDRAKATHPDVAGGDAAAFQSVQDALSQGLAARNA